MRVAYFSSEVFPYSKTGGLADVAGSLPAAVSAAGCDVKIFTPKYSSIDAKAHGLRKIGVIPEFDFNGYSKEPVIYLGKLPDSDVEVYFIDCPEYFDREEIYTNAKDEAERFAFFSKAALEAIIFLKQSPDVIHINDWQTALVPLYLKDFYSNAPNFKKAKTLFTIHNIGYQGKFNKRVLKKIGIDKKYYYPGGPAEFYDEVNFMKLGIIFSDLINTVSRTYAEEILTQEFGEGLSGVLLTRRSDLFGILNGIDENIWNPASDKLIKSNYSFRSIAKKADNKKLLAEELNIPFEKEIPFISIISRMAVQKGFDILMDTIPYLLDENARWIFLGSGEPEYEEFFKKLSAANPGKIFVRIGYDDRLAHLIEAGSDMFLMPSKYEPCGLNQMYSLKYGTVPIVRKTGGLADTVFDWDEMKSFGSRDGNGFSFVHYDGFGLYDAVQRALEYFSNKNIWKLLQRNGMKQDFSWDSSAKKYLSIYKQAARK